jgi:N-methylhydantoinase A
MGDRHHPLRVSVRVGVDVGGTFTDVVIADGKGLALWKVPSTPHDPSEGFARGLEEALHRAGEPAVSLIAHGTTVATNAVLERKGARAALLTTDGFRDVLLIGRQNRPSLYDLFADRPEPLIPRERSRGVAERVAADGSVLVPMDEELASRAIDELLATEPESIAVCLLFAFVRDEHERRLRRLIEERAPGVRVSLSSEVLPEFREFERASTTALDAYVGPVVEAAMRRLGDRASTFGAPVIVMRSGGGTMTTEGAAREPVHTLLSGPAAGVRGAATAAAAAGLSDLVTLDMGGTSTDVCLVQAGEPSVTTESSIDGIPFRTPSLAVHTVGAGGGSVLWLDAGGALRAGPRSAGVLPGPACYARGGSEPTVTDAHLVLGQLDPTTFLGGRMRLDPAAAEQAIATLASRAGAGVRETAEAGLRAVRAHMAAAIRMVSVERGLDPRALALVAFGGAGPMHACALAEELEIQTVLVPPAAGALSALGLLAAPLSAEGSLTRPLSHNAIAAIEETFSTLEARAREALGAQGAEAERVERLADCRYVGQSHEVSIDADDATGIDARFARAHHDRFGWSEPGEDVEIVTFRVRAQGPAQGVSLPPARPESVRGPALLHEESSTTLVGDGWSGERVAGGSLLLRRA